MRNMQKSLVHGSVSISWYDYFYYCFSVISKWQFPHALVNLFLNKQIILMERWALVVILYRRLEIDNLEMLRVRSLRFTRHNRASLFVYAGPNTIPLLSDWEPERSSPANMTYCWLNALWYTSFIGFSQFEYINMYCCYMACGTSVTQTSKINYSY